MAEHGVPGRAEGHRAAADADAAAAVCHQCLPRPRAPIGCVYGVVCASCLEYFVRCVRVLAFAVVRGAYQTGGIRFLLIDEKECKGG